MNGIEEFFHSVYLDDERCKGCINCIKRCPTQAIRVRDGKAHIITERCIDCGECIRVCPHKAKKARFDSLDTMKLYDYKIALPPPSLYAQYNNIQNQNLILESLLMMGFDDVFEVAYAAEIISKATREFMKSNKAVFPVLSCACPAITRLIRVRYPSLIKQILPLYTPAELAGVLSKREAMEKTGLPADRIGTFFITPCPSKVTAAHAPLGLKEPVIDRTVSIGEVYPIILKNMKNASLSKDLSMTGRMGVAWAEAGGEATALQSTEKYLAVDGIENVIRVLDDLEDEKYTDLEFVELNACAGGCVGGVLQVENPYIARTKLKHLNHVIPHLVLNDENVHLKEYEWSEQLHYMPVMELGENRDESISRYIEMQKIMESLPGLDCGSCGAPTCETFAEDIVRGKAKIDDCVVIMRHRMERIINHVAETNPELLKEITDDQPSID